ncbi:hypothetical protein NG791_09840 [Laspinema sp. D1]|nr:hypothetical protein [Laspinema sp. D2b]
MGFLSEAIASRRHRIPTLLLLICLDSPLKIGFICQELVNRESCHFQLR